MTAIDRVRDRFQALVQSFASSPVMRVRRSDVRWRDPDAALERALAAPRLPAPLVALYRALESMRLEWSLPDDADGIDYLDAGLDIVGGEVRILSLTEMLEGVDGVRGRALLDPYTSSSADVAARLDQLVPLEYCASEHAVCLQRDAAGEIVDRLVLVPLDGLAARIDELGVGTAEYLERGFEARFFHRWQSALFLGDARAKRTIDHYLPQLF